MKKVLIAIPCMDTVPTQFAQSISTLEKAGPTVIAYQVGSLVHSSRNNLAIEAVKQGADLVFWLDSDMMFPSGVLRYMLQELEKLDDNVILSGVYFRRVAPFSPVAYTKLDINEKNEASWEELVHIPEDKFEVEGIGFGCVLMPTQALIDVQAKYGTMFNFIGGTGEDLSFCWRARQCGYKIIADPKIELGHVAHHVVTRDLYMDYLQMKEEGAIND